MLTYVATLSLSLAHLGSSSAPMAQEMPPLRLVTIDVVGDPAYDVPSHQIQIDTTAPTLNPTAEALAQREWTATRRMNDETETISSRTCPALRAVALSFSELPAVPVQPVVGRLGNSFPNGPTMRDGFATSLTFDTVTSDNAMVNVRVSGWGLFQA